MEPPSPARLYAAGAGALLFALGVVGFFYDASFGGLGDLEPALAGIEVNAWLNLLYLATGAVGVLVAGADSRRYALGLGVLYALLALVGWGTTALNLAVALPGLAAALSTPRKNPHPRLRGSKRTKSVRKEPQDSEAGAQPARERA